jgi:hypothetical protein
MPSLISRCIINAIVVFGSVCLAAVNSTSAQQPSQGEAEKVWEQVIKAKGGRERLYSVRNMVISSSGSYKPLRFKIRPRGEVKSGSAKQSGLFRVAFCVFPNKFWSWEDYRPSVFGLWVSMYNYETGIKYIITEGEPNRPQETIPENELANEGMSIVQLMYLLESKWLKPRPVNVTARRAGFRVVDVVQTEVEGERYDYTIDRATRLPIRFTFYTQNKGKVYTYLTRLSDYADVEGIKVPLTIEMEDNGQKERSEIKFNVEYDGEIFTKAPSIRGGPEAWRKSKDL